MADEERRRRRGRRRGRQEGRQALPEDNAAAPESTAVPDSTALPGAAGPAPAASSRDRGPKKRQRVPSGTSPDVSPMDFWRSGRVRSHREKRVITATGPKGLWKRLTSFYFPPWVPVAGIIVVVFAILGLLFISREATGAPRIGEDHWHATYTFTVCGQKQPNAPTWEGVGVHTHGDGVVHIHPFSRSEEGSGARLVKWFEYGGGKLTNDSIRMPGSNKEWKNGDTCPDGTVGEVQVFVNSQRLNNVSRYLPKDGDRIRLVFGPPEEITTLTDRTIIGEEGVTSTVNIEVTGNDAADPPEPTQFSPASIQVDAGAIVKIVLTNNGTTSHGLRINGPDGEYDTSDDFVVVPEGSDPSNPEGGDLLEPGATGFVIVRFDDAGTFEFRDQTTVDATGSIIVRPGTSATPAPTGDVLEPVDATLTVTAGDSFFDPDELTVDAGEKFRIEFTNEGEFVHNLRIAGPDGEYDTDDDIIVPDAKAGEETMVVGQIDEPGEYEFRDDFRRQATGTLTVE